MKLHRRLLRGRGHCAALLAESGIASTQVYDAASESHRTVVAAGANDI
jgi:hypothetical protein